MSINDIQNTYTVLQLVAIRMARHGFFHFWTLIALRMRRGLPVQIFEIGRILVWQKVQPAKRVSHTCQDHKVFSAYENFICLWCMLP